MRLVEVTLLLVMAMTVTAQGQLLTVVSWGGSYEAAQKRAIFEPFTRETGIEISVQVYDGSIEAFQERAVEERWDVIDMVEEKAITGCKSGLLHEFDAEQVVIPDTRIPLRRDFVDAAFKPCSVTQNVYASVVAYDVESFPGIKPTSIDDFFDVDTYPGKRGAKRSPDAILEWALLAEGVPTSQVYDLLSTDRGMNLALRKLDEIRDHIVWWEDVAESIELIASGEVTMSSGFNGRFFSAATHDGLPITIIWDGRLIGHEVWAISGSSENVELAKKFIGFATAPEQLAALAEIMPYGPARSSGRLRVGLNPDTAIPMQAHLPNAPQHGERSLRSDSLWYANTDAMRNRRFRAWLGEAAE